MEMLEKKTSDWLSSHASETITLNVGGEVMHTDRKTLTSCPTSMLAAMFSGRHIEKKGNRYYILILYP